MRKILFIDRDGTLIKEAPPTYQIDSASLLVSILVLVSIQKIFVASSNG